MYRAFNSANVGSSPTGPTITHMLTIEEYKQKFPEGFSFGSFSGTLYPGAILLSEGYLLFTPESAYQQATS